MHAFYVQSVRKTVQQTGMSRLPSRQVLHPGLPMYSPDLKSATGS